MLSFAKIGVIQVGMLQYQPRDGLFLQNLVGISFLNHGYQHSRTKTIWLWIHARNSIHLSPLNRGLHPKRHPLLDLWLETGAWASPLLSTLRPTNTRPPPQGSATRPAAAAHRREVESFRRRVKEASRRRPGGFRCRWRELEHDGWVAGGSCRCSAESEPGLLQSLGGARGRPRLEVKPRGRFFKSEAPNKT